MSDQEGVTMTWEDDVPVQPLNIKTEINAELLLKIKEHVLANPEHVDMEQWVNDERWLGEESDGEREDIYRWFHQVANWAGKPEQFAQTCNTTACVAGWAVVLSPVEEGEAELLDYAKIDSVARGLLRINYTQSELLFHVESWPLHLGIRYDRAETPQERAQAVADRIDHFIATNGEE